MSDAEEDVRAAYRWILGRDADSGGLDHYAERLRSGKLIWPDLRRALLESPEFTQGKASYVAVDIGNDLKAVVDPQEPEFGRHIAAGGGWEPHIVDAIRSNLALGQTFVDVGGNVGIMSFNAAAVVGPTGKVVAFEPNPQNVSAFRRGVIANEFANVTLFPLALSDHRHMIGLTSASNAKVLGDALATQAAEVIQAIPADEILQYEQRLDLIKIDIEGYELPALKGMRQALACHKPKVLCEFNPLCLNAQGGIDARTLADFIYDLTDIVELVEHDGGRTKVRSAASLMALWQERDKAATFAGHLPSGWVHFDLLFQIQ
ncbi:FkbM family methyltransferase [Sphingomonas sp. SRS2]|uniref:FkbM family methyltransferase n=1 Tax=Sphingomonas sp. SRS2 TaxID=133190 RepID=UPI000696EF43|nr:FkbM family methyltransferase [Sphingomonas sp. SRS2]